MRVLELRKIGLTSPVLSVECKYKHTTTFDDEIKISTRVEKYTGVKVTFAYVITNTKTGREVFTGRTEHCFIDTEGFPVIVRKRYPEMDETLRALVNE